MESSKSGAGGFHVDLSRRVALITGAESGIGAACARAVARAGANIGILYFHDEAAARQVRADVEAAGAQGVVVQADVGQEDQVQAAFDRVAASLGLPDLLINSAGLNMSGVRVADMPVEQWERMIRTDLTGPFLTSRAFVRGLRAARRGGRIVNISSIHEKAPRPGGADYDAAKGGLANLTSTLALEVAADRINVNSIAPGMILTPMNGRAMTDSAYRQGLEAAIPWQRAGLPEEVADLAAFLCSDAADYITGASFTIDGGLSLVLGQGA
ncbi:MAG: short-chain dehydrogenase [Caulobacteraceae bacterium]|nr:short-chain dehydrogenase [Caulobacteraceae bacterium]